MQSTHQSNIPGQSIKQSNVPQGLNFGNTIYETTMLNQQSIKQTNIPKQSQNNNYNMSQQSIKQSEKGYPSYHQSKMQSQLNKQSNIQQQSNMMQQNQYNQSNIPPQSSSHQSQMNNQNNMYNQSIKQSNNNNLPIGTIYETKMLNNQSNINNLPVGTIYETKMLNNQSNINNIQNNTQISSQQNNNIVPPSTHQSKVNGSNAYNQSNYQNSGYNNNISQKRNDSFPTSNMPGKNVAKTAMPENPFGLNQEGSQLPMLAEKIMKSNA